MSSTDPDLAGQPAPRLEQHQVHPDDRGRLALDTRRAIVALVRGPYLGAEQQPDAWRALLRDRAAVERHLGNMFLELVLDAHRGIAFVRNAELGVETPRVVRQVRLSLLDTALLLDLRQRLLHDVDVTGRVFVDRADLEQALEAYRPQATTNLSGFARAVSAAIDKMRTAQVLLGTGQPERFEVSPVLAVVFDADELAAVAADLARLQAGGLDGLEADPDADMVDGDMVDGDMLDGDLDDEFDGDDLDDDADGEEA